MSSASRGSRDRGYRHLFKGSVLVSTLMEHDRERFGSREEAIVFAQRMLDAGHIESVVGSSFFDDSVTLYRWRDETVVREARRMVSTTSSYIPRNRLIQLLDLNQAGDPDAEVVYDLREVQERLQSKFDGLRSGSALVAAPCTFSPSASPGGADWETERLRDMLIRPVSPPLSCSNSDSGVRARRRMRQCNVSPFSDVAGPLHIHTVDGYCPQRQSPLLSGSLSNDTLSTIHALSSPATLDNSIMNRRRSRSQTYIESRLTPPPSPTRHKEEFFNRLQEMESGRLHHEINPLLLDRASSPFQSTPTRETIDDVSICRYDGIDMPALDLENFEAFSRGNNNNIADEYVAQKEQLETSISTGVPTTPNNLNDCAQEQQFLAATTDRRPSLVMDTTVHESPDHSRPGPTTPVIPDASPVAQALAAIQQSLDSLEEESHGYSDNEKQLLVQMKKMQQEHENVIQSYESKINDLIGNIDGLKLLAEAMDAHGKSQQSQDAVGPLLAPENPAAIQRNTADEEMTPAKPAAAPPAPPPPPGGGGGAAPPPPPPPPHHPHAPSGVGTRLAQPSKTPVKPRVKMRPLFWNRIIFDGARTEEGKRDTLWHSATEPNFAVDEFEKLFGRPPGKEADRTDCVENLAVRNRGRRKAPVSKILEENRSRAVGIKIRSLHCTVDDLRLAVCQLNFSKVDLDSLQSLRQMKASKDELEAIQVHVNTQPNVPLDEPEMFLLRMSTIDHFCERIECLVLKRSFNETLFNIDQQLETLQNACEEIRSNESLKTILELILAFGNYMNGGTQRGQADGFDLLILPKLKDVKAMDNSTNLLQYIVRVHCREHEADAGKNEATFRLSDPAVLQQASNVSFKDIDSEMTKLKTQLEAQRRTADLVCLNSDNDTLQPFKDQMDDFFDSADHMLSGERKRYADTKTQFEQVLAYLAVKPTDQLASEDFFSTWAHFFEDYKREWQSENRRIAREMFEKVDKKRKERMRTMKRRRSIMGPVEDSCSSSSNGAGGAGLKQRFAQLRRRSENQTHTFKLLRSQSVTNIDEAAETDSADLDAEIDAWKLERRPNLTSQISDRPTSASSGLELSPEGRELRTFTPSIGNHERVNHHDPTGETDTAKKLSAAFRRQAPSRNGISARANLRRISDSSANREKIKLVNLLHKSKSTGSDTVEDEDSMTGLHRGSHRSSPKIAPEATANDSVFTSTNSPLASQAVQEMWQRRERSRSTVIGDDLKQLIRQRASGPSDINNNTASGGAGKMPIIKGQKTTLTAILQKGNRRQLEPSDKGQTCFLPTTDSPLLDSADNSDNAVRYHLAQRKNLRNIMARSKDAINGSILHPTVRDPRRQNASQSAVSLQSGRRQSADSLTGRSFGISPLTVTPVGETVPSPQTHEVDLVSTQSGGHRFETTGRTSMSGYEYAEAMRELTQARSQSTSALR